MKKFNQLLLLAALCLWGTAARAQISAGGTPPSFAFEESAPAKQIARKQIPIPFNAAELIARDRAEASSIGTPPRVGKIIPVDNFTTENSGEWTALPDGQRIWRLSLDAPGAIAIMLTYKKFAIPEGGKLFIYNTDRSRILGAYTEANNPKRAEYATEFISGDQLTLEYAAPPFGDINTSPITITGVVYGYNNLYVEKPNENGPSLIQFDPSGNCMVNVNCSEGDNWKNEKQGVARIVTPLGDGYYSLCSGSVINNTAQNLDPLFLSAYHCYNSLTPAQMNQAIYYFKYEHATCTGRSDPSVPTITGATMLATSPMGGGSDGALVRLNEQIPESYGVYYNGWDRRDNAATSGVGIHHPLGDVKKISTFTKPATSDGRLTFSTGDGSQSTTAANSAWLVYFAATTHGHGVTQSGSSGSPLFNQEKRVVGTLTGGLSACTYTDGTNYYGKLWYHWDQSSNQSQWMKPFLDPLNSGLEYIDGTYVVGTPTAGFDADRTTVYASETITFTDVSHKAEAWYWEFEGGAPSTFSGKTPPPVLYNTPGSYSVKLTINKGTEDENVLNKANYIIVKLKENTCAEVMEIGAGTATSQYPFGALQRFTTSSSIYKAAELGGGGLITKVAWNAAAAPSTPRALFTVYMKEVDEDEQVAATVSDEISKATTVYLLPTSTISYWANDIGWNELTLTTPFRYSGTKNLKIIVREYTSGMLTHTSSECYYTPATNAHQEWTNTAVSNPTGTGTINSNRPNIKISIDHTCAMVPLKADFTVGKVYTEDFEGENFETQGISLSQGWEIATSPASTAYGWTTAHTQMYNYNFAIIDRRNSSHSIVCPASSVTPFESTLKTPEYMLDENSVAEFYLLYNKASLALSSMDLRLSTDGGASWTTVWTSGTTPSPAEDFFKWRKVSVDLSAYNNKNIRLAWVYKNLSDPAGMVLDGLKVSSSGKSVRIFEGQQALLTDRSQGPPVTWNWTLPNSVEQTSLLQSPSPTYMNLGTYSASLKVTNNAGSDSKTVDAAIIVLARTPKPDFASSSTGLIMRNNFGQFLPMSGGTVSLKDQSSYYPKSREWTATGATPASGTDESIQVSYPAGSYSAAVTLKAENTAGAATVTKPDYVKVGGTAEVWNVEQGEEPSFPYSYNGVPLTGASLFSHTAERFSVLSPGEVSQVRLYTRSVYQTTAGSLTVAIYSDEKGIPGSLVSPVFTVQGGNNRITNGGYTTITFPEPVPVSGSFHVVMSSSNFSAVRYNVPTVEKRGETGKNTVNVRDGGYWMPLSTALGYPDYTLSMNVVAEFTYTTGELKTPSSFKRKDIDPTVGSISFTTNGRSWRATADSWIKLSASSGKVAATGAGSLTFTCSNNTESHVRTGSIVVYAGGVPLTITVKQGGSYPANFTAAYNDTDKNIQLAWGGEASSSTPALPVSSLQNTAGNNPQEAAVPENSMEGATAPPLQRPVTQRWGLQAGQPAASAQTQPAKAPEMAFRETKLRWDNGTYNTAIGSANGGFTEVAIKFGVADLTEYSSATITAVEILFMVATADMKLNIRQGETIVHTQALSGLKAGQFNRITLTKPLKIDSAKDLMVGYSFTQAPGQANFVPGSDAGPAVAGKGDLISFDGIEFLSLYDAAGLSHNWNMAAIVKVDNNATYRIWRNSSVVAEGLTEETYRDLAATIGTDYCYSITATYEDDPYFESTKSPEQCAFAKSPLVLQADNKEKQENQPNPAFTSSVSGQFLGADTETDIKNLITFDCLANELSPAGTYAITPLVDNSLSGKYAFDKQSGVLNVAAFPNDISQQPVVTSANAFNCQGSSANFTAAATGLEVTYRWQKQAKNSWVNVDGANELSYTIPSLTPADAGNYRLLVSGRSAVTASNVVTLKVGLPPADILVFEWDDLPTVNCNPQTNGGYNFVSFQWYKNGSRVEGATKPYILAEAGTSYNCDMTTSDGRVFNICDYTYQAAQSTLVVYPNPVSQDNKFTLQHAGAADGTVAHIYSVSGALVKGHIPIHGSESTFTATGLKPGLYVIQTVSPNGAKQTAKFVVK